MRQAGAQQGDEVSETLYPIQLVQVGPLHDVPAPLVRITTCGRVTLEVVQEVVSTDPPQARYCVVNPPERGKGSSTALNLLKLLASLPAHAATRDWLSEHLPHNRLRRCKSEQKEDEDIEGGMERVDNVVTLLRKMLCPPQIEGSNVLRPALVALLKNHKDSGPGYQLASAPLLWLDVDEIASLVQRACQREQGGQEALSVWEQVYALAARGSYLPLEVYSDWATEKRTEIDGYLKQAVLALHRLYLARDGQASEERVLLLLRTYCRSHPTDEDVLRPLLELLGKRDCVQETLAYYQRLRALLEEEGYEPDPRTQQTVDNLRVAQSQPEQAMITTKVSAKIPNIQLLSHAHQQEMLRSASFEALQNFMKDENALPSHGHSFKSELLSSVSTPLSIPSFFRTDVDVLTNLSIILSQPSIVDKKELTYFDQQTRLYWRAREQTALPTIKLYTYVIRHIDDLTLVLAHSHLPLHRSYLCETVCRTVLLAGILLYDMGQYAKARQHYYVAFQAATEAGNSVLQAIVWGWMSFTWTYAKQYTGALKCVQYARSFAARTTNIITQAWLGAIEAEIQAHLHNTDACLQALRDMEGGIGAIPSQDISYLFEFNPVLLLGYKGICLQQFYQRQKPATHRLLQEAKTALEQALESEAPQKRKLYYLSDLAGVYARQEEVETACAYVIQCIPLMQQIGSGSKTIYKHLLQVRALLQPNEHTSFVQALDEQMAPLLIGMQGEEV